MEKHEKKEIVTRSDPERATIPLPAGTTARLVAEQDVTSPGCNESTRRVFVLEFEDENLETLLAHASRGRQVLLLQEDWAATGRRERMVSQEEAVRLLGAAWPSPKAWRYAPV